MAVDLQQQFDGLPKDIRIWLSSERVTHLVSGINDSLNLSKEASRRIIPRTILRLATQDVSPQDFIAELSTAFDISRSSARIIAEEIDKKIFGPIQRQLFNDVGVDTKLIFLKSDDFFTSADSSAVRQDLAEPNDDEVPTATGPKVIALEEKEAPASPPAPAPAPQKSTEPFVVRKEESLAPISDFRLKRPQVSSPPSQGTEPPVSARVQLGAPDASGRRGEQKRIVHYGGYRTMLPPKANSDAPASTHNAAPSANLPEKPAETIDLRTFSRVSEGPTEAPRFPQPTSEPRVSGNRVDLREEER